MPRMSEISERLSQDCIAHEDLSAMYYVSSASCANAQSCHSYSTHAQFLLHFKPLRKKLCLREIPFIKQVNLVLLTMCVFSATYNSVVIERNSFYSFNQQMHTTVT